MAGVATYEERRKVAMQKKILPTEKFFEHPLFIRAKSFATKKNIIFAFILLIGIVTINLFINRSVKKPAFVVEEKVQQKDAAFLAEGKILDKNQQLIEGVFVIIDGKSAVTDKDGIWKISLSAKPVNNILILANGYEKLSKTYTKDEAVTLTEISKTSATVTILGADNKPIPDAFVLYLDSNSYKPTVLQKTDNNGQVKFLDIPKDKGSFLVIMDGYKAGSGIADLKDKDSLTILLEKPDQIPLDTLLATSSAQTQNKERNVDIYYDPSKDKYKVTYSVVYKINPEKLYEELKALSSFNSDKSLQNVSIFSSDSEQSLISVDKINITDKGQTGSQVVVFGNSANNDNVVSSIPLSVVLTKEYLLSITDKKDVIATILKLYSDESLQKETTIVFKTENPNTVENTILLHDESYLSYAVLSAKPEQKSDYYRYESSYCLENFDIPLYKPHGRVVLDRRYYGDRNTYCEYHIERDASEVVGEGKTKVVTNSIIGWYKNEMESNGWIVTPDIDTLQSIFFPRSEYIPAEFKKCKKRDDKTWEGIDVFVYEGIVPEPYGMFKEQLVFKLLMVQRRLFSPSKSELEYYGCPLEAPTSTQTSTPMPTAKPFSVSGNIPKEGCFDTDGGEEAGINAGVRKGFDNPLVKGRVYINGKDYTIIEGKKTINEDRCVGGWIKEYRCAKNYSGKLTWAVPYTSYCPVSNTSCRDGACVPMPPSPTPKILTTECSNSYGGMCIDCDDPPEGYISCRGNSIPSCPKNDTCTYFKYFQFNPNTFEWEFK
ncbi:hypothetical protein HY345_00390 [Candidatus Microgenomates bacterium]|nr:hypothetical protein [Candidatus Microgenomates bacterium]